MGTTIEPDGLFVKAPLMGLMVINIKLPISELHCTIEEIFSVRFISI